MKACNEGGWPRGACGCASRVETASLPLVIARHDPWLGHAGGVVARVWLGERCDPLARSDSGPSLTGVRSCHGRDWLARRWWDPRRAARPSTLPRAPIRRHASRRTASLQARAGDRQRLDRIAQLAAGRRDRAQLDVQHARPPAHARAQASRAASRRAQPPLGTVPGARPSRPGGSPCAQRHGLRARAPGRSPRRGTDQAGASTCVAPHPPHTARHGLNDRTSSNSRTSRERETPRQQPPATDRTRELPNRQGGLQTLRR
jgi:hypothetical protein